MAAELRETAVAGIGWTEFSKNSGRSELRLATEAIKNALDDAGLVPQDIDGYVTYEQDSNVPALIASNLGVRNLSFWSLTNPGGGGACAAVSHAAMAVAAGMAEVVVCLRALNERSGRRFGQSAAPARIGGRGAHYFPYGLVTPAQWVAIKARRHMHDYGTTSAHFGAIAVAARKHAQRNPNATFYGRPITLEDHQNSRMIADPLHLLDCCLETDGACAVVVTTLERAKDLKQPPVRILATAQGSGPGPAVEIMTGYNGHRIAAAPETKAMGETLFRRADVTAGDVDVAQIYDHFTPLVLMAIEALGFCGEGEGGPWLEGGRAEWPDGELPLNTSGSLLSEGYIHGMNLVLEGVRQVRGTSTAQVPNAQVSLVTAGNGVPTSGAIFTKG
jgi:acetyl-CoA acetyltransferase